MIYKEKKIFRKMFIVTEYAALISYPSIYTSVLGPQKNHLKKTVLLSTHNICFSLEISNTTIYFHWIAEYAYAK